MSLSDILKAVFYGLSTLGLLGAWLKIFLARTGEVSNLKTKFQALKEQVKEHHDDTIRDRAEVLEALISIRDGMVASQNALTQRIDHLMNGRK